MGFAAGRTQQLFPHSSKPRTLAATILASRTMNKYSVIISLSILVSLYSCSSGKYTTREIITPKEFLTSPMTDKKKYNQDKETILAQINRLFLSRDESFENEKYIDSTYFSVDTLLYDNELNKIAAFILQKFPSSRSFPQQTECDWVYSGYCYLGQKQVDTFNLKWFSDFSFKGYCSKKEVQYYLYHLFITRSAPNKKLPQTNVPKYNMDDKRFWESENWRRIFR